MKELLASVSLDAQLGSMDLSSYASSSDNLSAGLNLRYDAQIEQERWFIDLLGSEDMQWTSSETSAGGDQEEQRARTPVAGDSWAALDFILALEHPCRDHVHHPFIHPKAWLPAPGAGHGHAMTATAAVFASAQSPSGSGGQSARAPGTWHLPHSEIDK